jgi:hypothetical protein
MRSPAPITPSRNLSFAPKTRVEASAVSPLAMRKLRRVVVIVKQASSQDVASMLSSFSFSAMLHLAGD